MNAPFVRDDSGAKPSLFGGRWELDNRRSSWSNGQFPTTGMKLEIELGFDGTTLTYRSGNDTDPAAPKGLIFEAPMDGTPCALTGSDRYDTVRVRLISTTEFEILHLKQDDVIVAAYWRVSESGNALMRWGVGKSPAGLSKAYEEYFTRRP